MARLAHSDRLVLAYQLPLPQALVLLARALDPDPFWTRIAFAAVGALVPLALAAVVQARAGAPAAHAAALMAAVHPLFLHYSTVPYQEPVLLVLLLAALAALDAGRPRLGVVLVGLACLCRYEAWIAAALVSVALVRAAAASPEGRAARLALALCGLAVPLAWVSWWGGLGPPGTYVVDPAPLASMATRASHLASKLREYTGLPWLVLATLGLGAALREAPRWRGPLGFATLVVVATVAAGHEHPPGSGRVSERMLHVPVAAVCLLSGLGVVALAGAAPPALRHRTAAVLTALVATAAALQGLGTARRLAREAAQEPSLDLAVSVARVATVHLPPGDTLAVLGPPVDDASVAAYVARVAHAGGDAAAARVQAAALARRGRDGDLVAAHLPRPPRLVTRDPASADLVAAYDDGPPYHGPGSVLARFAAGPRAVTVYQRRP